jgi:hypothetical protein
MTTEQDVGPSVVQIRTPRYALILPLLIAGMYRVLAASAGAGGDQPGLAHRGESWHPMRPEAPGPRPGEHPHS